MRKTVARAVPPPSPNLAALLYDVARDNFLAGEHASALRELAALFDAAQIINTKDLKEQLVWANLWRVNHPTRK